MVAGYVHRSDPEYLTVLARSSVYLNAISNRLAASSQRARLLGMIVGSSISEIVDPPDKRLAFSSEEMDNTERGWYGSLTKVQDHIGSVNDLQDPFLSTAHRHTKPNTVEHKDGKELDSVSNKSTTTSKIISIEEIDDEVESEDGDLVMYDKPDSDSEDEDEDPTLVQRNKATAPV